MYSGLEDSLFTDDKLECYGAANYLKAGIVYADEVTTVSPSYAEEIQTAYYGERLDGLLRAKRNRLSGVLNGIDVEAYDPANDKYIAAKYSSDDLSGKAICKRALQTQLNLDVRPEVPIIGMVGRLSNQKGLDLVDYVIGDIMREDVQLVCLGMGDSRYVNLFSWAEQNYPGRVAARFVMDNPLAHQIYAGSDLFLMPSQFEPCGLSQMMAMRYGTIPVVRKPAVYAIQCSATMSTRAKATASPSSTTMRMICFIPSKGAPLLLEQERCMESTAAARHDCRLFLEGISRKIS